MTNFQDLKKGSSRGLPFLEVVNLNKSLESIEDIEILKRLNEESTIVRSSYNGKVSLKEIDYLAVLLVKDKAYAQMLKKEESIIDVEEIYALAILLVEDIVFTITSISAEGETTESVGLYCDNLFLLGVTDSIELEDEDILDLYAYYFDESDWGAAVWAMKKRNMLPDKQVYNFIQKSGLWDLNQLNLRHNQTWDKK